MELYLPSGLMVIHKAKLNKKGQRQEVQGEGIKLSFNFSKNLDGAG